MKWEIGDLQKIKVRDFEKALIFLLIFENKNTHLWKLLPILYQGDSFKDIGAPFKGQDQVIFYFCVKFWSLNFQDPFKKIRQLFNLKQSSFFAIAFLFSWYHFVVATF